MKSRRAFSLIDAMVAAVVLGLVATILPPIMHANRGAAGLYISLNNVRTITRAMHQYNTDTGGQFPMRGNTYRDGSISNGWDPWNMGGKNCDSTLPIPPRWNNSFADELAYWRPLNAYVSGIAIPQPTNSVNTGSGSTWNFKQGKITDEDRQSLEMPVFQSPGDTVSYQGSSRNVNLYGTPDPNGISCYDAVGTSYVLNTQWYNAPEIYTISGFTNQFDTGVKAFADAVNGTPRKLTRDPSKKVFTAPLSKIVWLTDQHAPLVLNRGQFGANGPPTPFAGEFGGDDRSVSGFLDGHVDYVQYETGVLNNNTYHMFPWLP